ncbi:MAG TPA: hypothetical protein QGG30_05750 [Acidobacteriota bacterium]|jgi:hypothetical protein|nr:hypothetical protein [Acidobacteriota bacterium]MEC7900219.1 hypothetical protein [Acidobacteriota bacterium]HJO29971.1 hypothetical protein [Acidobacteriota bacterium]|tara:strand:+ start:1410 stop:2150 length:741 start_codon:yes stop_codon:yes gene_type:complete
MNHRATRVVSQAFLCLLGMSMWTAVAAPKAHAAQLSGTDTVEVNRHQEPQPPELQDSRIGWISGWSYGGRGILSRSGQENLDSGLGFTVFSVRRLIADLELETEIGRLIMSPKTDGLLPLGHMSMFPLRATLRVQLWRFGGAKPYAGGGIGVYLNRFDVDESVAAELATTGFATAVNVNPAFGFHGAGGVEWQRGPANFNVDVKYMVAKANVVSTLVDQLNEKVSREISSLDLGGFWLAAGIRFNF